MKAIIMMINIFHNLKRILTYPYRKINDFLIQNEFKNHILSKMSDEEVFEWIYKNNYWGNSESVSGYGSTLVHTKLIRAAIPRIIDELKIESIFDAPCGDMNWMNQIIKNVNINYIGVDIVDELIRSNNEKYAGSNVQFRKMNLLEDSYPNVDLMICRDFLFHLSNANIFRILKKFIESGSKYILTTSYDCNSMYDNSDIINGDFRYLNLTQSPFNIKEIPLFIIEDYIPGDIKRYLYLWSNEQIRNSIS